VAPLLRAFAGADILLEDDLTTGNYGACIAVSATDETYDWEIRSRLQDWLVSAAAGGACGLAAGERQQYRGVAIAFAEAAIAAPKIDGSTLIKGRARLLE
jgi:hypothetical protein